MRKRQWVVIIVALIGCMVSFTSCEQGKKMMEPLLPDAETVEPVLPEVETVEPVMPETQLGDPSILTNSLIIAEARVVNTPRPETSNSPTAPQIEGNLPEVTASVGSIILLPFEYSGTNTLAGCIVYIPGVGAYYEIPYSGGPDDLPSAIPVSLSENVSPGTFIEVCYGVYDNQGQASNFLNTVINVVEEVPTTDVMPGDGLFSDEFNDSGQSLQPFWHVQNGDKSPHMLSGGNLVVEGGFWQNLWSEDSSTRFYQITDQDRFTVETSMVFDHRDVSSVAGLVIFSPTTQDFRGRDGEWINLKLWGHGAADQNGNIGNISEGRDASGPGLPHTAFLQFQHRARGIAPDYPGYNPPQGNIRIAMRLERNGDEYEAWFKPDGEGEWLSVGKTTAHLQGPLEVGLFVGISQPEAPGGLTVSFDYFRVTTTE